MASFLGEIKRRKVLQCGSCVPGCPVGAIFDEDDLPKTLTDFIRLNAKYAPGWPTIMRRAIFRAIGAMGGCATQVSSTLFIPVQRKASIDRSARLAASGLIVVTLPWVGSLLGVTFIRTPAKFLALSLDPHVAANAGNVALLILLASSGFPLRYDRDCDY